MASVAHKPARPVCAISDIAPVLLFFQLSFCKQITQPWLKYLYHLFYLHGRYYVRFDHILKEFRADEQVEV